MVSNQTSPLLRQALLADGVISGATGLMMVLGAGFLAGLLDLPESLLRNAGFILAPYVAFVLYVALRRPIPLSGVWTVIVANILWASASVALLFTGLITPNALGIAFMLFQALVVAGFSAVQFLAVRRTAVAAA